MSDALAAITSGLSNGKQPSKRVLSAGLQRQGRKRKYVQSLGKKVQNSAWIHQQIVQGITDGEIEFSDGRKLIIEDIRLWVDLVKFMYQHIDGPAREETVQVNGLAVFKVYAGIDTDKV